MPFGPSFGFGLQRLLDSQYNFFRAGHCVWLRYRNFPDVQSQEYAQLGFAISPTGQYGQTGTTDIPIYPPPSVKLISSANIAKNSGQLRFGKRKVCVSATFVDTMAKRMGIEVNSPQQDLIWRSPQVVGLIIDGSLFKIESWTHSELGGKSVFWELDVAGNEIR